VTIPEDIMEMATEVALSCDPSHKHTPGYLIARALYAERRRCAAIAKAFVLDIEHCSVVHADADKIFRAVMSDGSYSATATD
jgi:hypothetical protein